MNVRCGNVDFPRQGIAILIEFTGREPTPVNIAFDPRLSPIADIMGEKLKKAVDAAMEETAKELKKQGIIKEGKQ